MLLNLVDHFTSQLHLIFKNHLSSSRFLLPHLSQISKASIIMMKVIVKVEINEEKIKKKAMKAVSGISGVVSVDMEMKGKKLTLTGDIDAVDVVEKLRKICETEIISVGAAKEEKEKVNDPIVPLMLYGTNSYYYYNQMKPQPQYYPYYSAVTMEEDPNSCVII